MSSTAVFNAGGTGSQRKALPNESLKLKPLVTGQRGNPGFTRYLVDVNSMRSTSHYIDYGSEVPRVSCLMMPAFYRRIFRGKALMMG